MIKEVISPMVLSVVIPVYNTASYLEGCLSSVLAGDCTDCEILLIDDGSTDGVSPGLCDRLSAAHPSLVQVIHQENRGLGGARNTGLEAARGEYVFFPDSDDTITPDALALIKQAIAKTGAEVIAFNLYSDDGAGHHTPVQANHCQPQEVFRASERPDFLLSLPSAWSRVWKRSLFLDTGIRFPSRVWYEDIRTTVKLFALAQSIVTLPNHLYLYLQRPGSIMRSSNVDRNREILDAFDDLLPWFKAHGLWDTYRDALCRLCIDHVYIAASVRVLQADPHHPLLAQFRVYLETQFPDYQKNVYLSQLPKIKKLVFSLLEGQHYVLLKWLFRIRGQ